MVGPPCDAQFFRRNEITLEAVFIVDGAAVILLHEGHAGPAAASGRQMPFAVFQNLQRSPRQLPHVGALSVQSLPIAEKLNAAMTAARAGFGIFDGNAYIVVFARQLGIGLQFRNAIRPKVIAAVLCFLLFPGGEVFSLRELTELLHIQRDVQNMCGPYSFLMQQRYISVNGSVCSRAVTSGAWGKGGLSRKQ